MIQFIVLFLGIFIFSFTDVNAQSYTNTANTFDSSTTQQLYNIALTRDEDFLNKNFIIFQNDTTYYLMSFKDYSFNNNVLSFSDSFIVRYYRDSNYYSNYSYEVYNEAQTSFNTSYIYVSNLNLHNSTGSSVHRDLLNDRNIIYLLMFMVGILFANFLLKERSSY